LLFGGGKEAEKKVSDPGRGREGIPGTKVFEIVLGETKDGVETGGGEKKKKKLTSLSVQKGGRSRCPNLNEGKLTQIRA